MSVKSEQFQGKVDRNEQFHAEQTQPWDQDFMTSEQPWSALATWSSARDSSTGRQEPPNVPEDMLQEADVQDDHTVCVSSAQPDEQHFYTCQVMVDKAGEPTWFATALLDSGSIESFVSESIALQAQDHGLTTIQFGAFKPYEGLALGHAVEVVGKMELKFSLTLGSKSYRHTFYVAKAGDRFEILLSDKFCNRTEILSMQRPDM